MPKRIGYLYDQVVSDDNCIQAVIEMTKDKRFLALNQMIIDSMGDGLAIGFYPAQWYANIVLAPVDRSIKQTSLPNCKYTRYMDDMLLLHNNKRHLKRAKEHIQHCLARLKLKLKHNWQIFRANRGVKFLTYRFFNGFTLMKKDLMIRISRKARAAAKHKSPHNAKAIMSYMGILKHCNSYNFRKEWVYPIVSLQKLRGVISYESKFCYATGTC